MSVYTTKTDIIEQAIIPAIEAGDATRDEYNLDAIADAAFEYSPELGGFVQTLSEDDFWAAVAEAAL